MLSSNRIRRDSGGHPGSPEHDPAFRTSKMWILPLYRCMPSAEYFRIGTGKTTRRNFHPCSSGNSRFRERTDTGAAESCWTHGWPYGSHRGTWCRQDSLSDCTYGTNDQKRDFAGTNSFCHLHQKGRWRNSGTCQTGARWRKCIAGHLYLPQPWLHDSSQTWGLHRKILKNCREGRLLSSDFADHWWNLSIVRHWLWRTHRWFRPAEQDLQRCTFHWERRTGRVEKTCGFSWSGWFRVPLSETEGTNERRGVYLLWWTDPAYQPTV